MHNRTTEIVFPYPDEIREYFAFRVHNYRHMPAYRNHGWDGSITLMKGSEVPTGLFLVVREEIEKGLNVSFRVKDRRTIPEFTPTFRPLKGYEVRQVQTDAVNAMISNAATGGIVINATGTGKTATAGIFFSRLVGKAVFVVNELSLLAQAREELSRVLGEQVGFVGDGVYKPKRITVATAQTMQLHGQSERFEKWKKSLSVMVIDELHEMLNGRQFQIADMYLPQTVYGLTATLEMKREDVRYKAHALCGPKIFSYEYADAVKAKHLTPGVVVGVDLRREILFDPEQQTPAEVYAKYIAKSKERNNLVESLVREALDRKRTVAVLVERLDHLRFLSRRLADIPHRVVCGRVTWQDRREAVAEMESQDVRLILANRVFKKGVNVKKLDCIIDAASTANGNDARQKFGRGVRLNPDKNGLIYVDIGDSPRRLGEKNLYQKGTKIRRKSLRDQKIIVRQALTTDPKEVFDLAFRLLK